MPFNLLEGISYFLKINIKVPMQFPQPNHSDFFGSAKKIF